MFPRPIAAAVAALLLGPAVYAADVSPAFADRFSIGGTVAPTLAPPAFTLLDPAWLLPPVESLELATAAASASERAGQILRDDAAAAGAAPRPRHAAPGGPLSYPLSDEVTAHVDYRHALLFDRADSQTARSGEPGAFSTRPDRDVVDLNMSWRLAGSTVGLGYQLESARAGSNIGDAGVSRFLPGSPQATHSFTLGLSREWGQGAPPPALVEVPFLPPELDVAAADRTPTPAP